MPRAVGPFVNQIPPAAPRRPAPRYRQLTDAQWISLVAHSRYVQQQLSGDGDGDGHDDNNNA